jgi:hypothetical protein
MQLHSVLMSLHRLCQSLQYHQPCEKWAGKNGETLNRFPDTRAGQQYPLSACSIDLNRSTAKESSDLKAGQLQELLPHSTYMPLSPLPLSLFRHCSSCPRGVRAPVRYSPPVCVLAPGTAAATTTTKRTEHVSMRVRRSHRSGRTPS